MYFSSKEELFKAVVRENISGRFSEWNTELETFEGNSADLLRSCVMSWWERVGSTKASGISKLMMSEAGNFPELAAFYQEEVVQPGNALIRKVLQRGVDAGEFRNLNVEYGVYLLLAPMMFLAMWQHAMKPCVSPTETFDPALYLQTHIDNLLMGLAVRPAAPLPREL